MISGSGFGVFLSAFLPCKGATIYFVHIGVFVIVEFWCPHTQGLIPQKSLGLCEKKFRMTCLFASSHAMLQCPPCGMTPPLSCSLVAKYQNSFKEELKLHLRQIIKRGRRVTKKGRLDKHEEGQRKKKEAWR